MRHRLARCGFAFALLAAPGIPAEEEPDMGRALAATLQHQRELIREAQGLADGSEVRDRGASSGAEALDAFEAALVEQGLLAPGATAEVAERGIPSRLKRAQPVPIPYPNLATRPMKPPAGDPKLLARVGRFVHAGAPASLIEAQWQKALKNLARKTDARSLVQWVVRQSYLENARDLRFYADKVKHFNELKRELRGQIRQRREKRVRSSSETFAEYIESLEQKLATIGDDAQLANVDLQNALQKQQQTMQMMSNVSKMLYDTAMATIRKIR